VTPGARSFVALAITILVTAGSVVAGLGLILNTRDRAEEGLDQSEANFELLRQVKEVSEINATLLRVVLAVTGCTATDSAEACSQRIIATGATQLIGLGNEIDCRVRLAIANLPPPEPGKACVG
jgi:hypothetical protein